MSPPRLRRAALLALLLALAVLLPAQGAPVEPAAAQFTCPGLVRFSPRGGAERLVVETLGQARERVHAALYGLTSPALEGALRDLARSGVRVALKTDRIQSAGRTQKALLERLGAAGVAVEVSRASRLLHHKFAVVDGRWVITGSFNWTTSAESRNRENVLVFDCPALARLFEAEWEGITPDGP